MCAAPPSRLGALETRDAAWTWFQTRVDDLAAKRPPARRGSLPWFGTYFCDRAHASELSALFAERIAHLDGGPRNLAGALEAMNLCAARSRCRSRPSARRSHLPEPKVEVVATIDPWAPKQKSGGPGGASGGQGGRAARQRRRGRSVGRAEEVAPKKKKKK